MHAQLEHLQDNQNQNIQSKEQLAALRKSLQNGLAVIKNDFQQKPNINKLFHQHCTLIDGLLITLWSTLSRTQSVA